MAPDLNDIWRRNRTYISYDALRRNPPTGRSSVGRTQSTPANAYTRGCSSIAEYEAALVKERTVAGLAAARARGRTGGRR